MNGLNILLGALALLMALLFFGFVALLWGLKQLLTIRQQNDTLIFLLEQIPVDIWNSGHIHAGLAEAPGGAEPISEHDLEVRRPRSRLKAI
ncbi:MAG: hypothetical protein WAU47_15160 [Desulfobaccales bacterium]